MFKRLKDAAIFLNLKGHTGIHNCLTGISNTSSGYHWYYLYNQTKKDGTITKGAISLGLITEQEALKQLNI